MSKNIDSGHLSLAVLAMVLSIVFVGFFVANSFETKILKTVGSAVYTDVQRDHLENLNIAEEEDDHNSWHSSEGHNIQVTKNWKEEGHLYSWSKDKHNTDTSKEWDEDEGHSYSLTKDRLG